MIKTVAGAFGLALGCAVLFNKIVLPKGRLSRGDPSSYSTPETEVIENIDLNWNINFDRNTINGTATYKFRILSKYIKIVCLDVHNITINSVAVKASGIEFPVNYFISDHVKGIGSKLTIELPTKTSGKKKTAIHVQSMPSTSVCHIGDVRNQFELCNQNPKTLGQSIAARSLLPCQDNPAVKFTYTATVTHPKHLTALLSGIRLNSTAGRTHYEQKVPIPSYLLAISVGAFESRQIGPISKVWAEKEIVKAAAYEFSETSKMLQIASDICGPYVWKNYDLVIMPPSFPFGGMENPCLTFLTPTLIAGDKSLTSVVGHEIAHSWTGNLVTNANLEHFWLNEGFTTFLEGKIVGRLEGDLARDFFYIMKLEELKSELQNQLAATPALTKLVTDLTGVSPHETYSLVPYVKGQTFLSYLEGLLGGPESFERFMRFYFNKYKFRSIRSEDFKAILYEYHREQYAKELAKIDWKTWLYGEGMPPIIPKYNTTLADVSHKHAKIWIANKVDNIERAVASDKLSTNQKIELLAKLNEAKNIVDLSTEWISLLESVYGLNKTQNIWIRLGFLRLCIKARQFNRMNEIIYFANSNFRVKYLRSLYRDWGQWPEARDIAIANYNKVKPEMMSITSFQVAKALELP